MSIPLAFPGSVTVIVTTTVPLNSGVSVDCIAGTNISGVKESITVNENSPLVAGLPAESL